MLKFAWKILLASKIKKTTDSDFLNFTKDNDLLLSYHVKFHYIIFLLLTAIFIVDKGWLRVLRKVIMPIFGKIEYLYNFQNWLVTKWNTQQFLLTENFLKDDHFLHLFTRFHCYSHAFYKINYSGIVRNPAPIS